MPVRKQKLKQIAVKLPSDLLERLRKESKRSGVSMSFIIRFGISVWLDGQKVKASEQGKLESKPLPKSSSS